MSRATIVSAAPPATTSRDPRAGPYPMGLMALLATVTMLFAAFTAAILVRRSAPDWTPVALPGLVWANLGVLAAASAMVERGRRSLRRGLAGPAASALGAGALLGLLFLAGQVATWSALADRGVLLPTNPHAAFFYTLSAVHGAHALGGVAALGWTWRRARRGAYAPGRDTGLLHAAVFWHYLGLVWLYLLVVLSTL
jgi:cytochrome c oxidase subunit 3